MDLHLSGKTALVTGASTSGCGRAIAMSLAREGVAVAARRLESLKTLAREIKAGGYIEPVVLAADLYDPETPKRLAAEASGQLGRVDILDPTEEARREFAQREIPVGRFGKLEELGELVCFLASPRAGYMTGTVIPVDGGIKRYAH